MFLTNWIYRCSWTFWLIGFLVMFLVLWLIVGGKEHRFVGVAPLFDANQPLPDNPFLPETPLQPKNPGTRTRDPRDRVVQQQPQQIYSSSGQVGDRQKKNRVTGRYQTNNDRHTEGRRHHAEAGGLGTPVATSPCEAGSGSVGPSISKPITPHLQVPSIDVEPFPDDHPDLPTETVGESLAEITEYLDREAGQPSSASGINATPIIPSAVISGQDPTNQGLFTNLRYRSRPNKPRKSSKRSKGETICCQTLEQIYGAPFDTVRPNWLKNPETGMNLELDCYNDDLRLAVEYNGIQHYVWPNFTRQSYDDFVKQVRRDRFKVDTCDINGVYLITVPYNVPHELIPRYIQWYLPEAVAARREISSN